MRGPTVSRFGARGLGISMCTKGYANMLNLHRLVQAAGVAMLGAIGIQVWTWLPTAASAVILAGLVGLYFLAVLMALSGYVGVGPERHPAQLLLAVIVPCAVAFPITRLGESGWWLGWGPSTDDLPFLMAAVVGALWAWTIHAPAGKADTGSLTAWLGRRSRGIQVSIGIPLGVLAYVGSARVLVMFPAFEDWLSVVFLFGFPPLAVVALVAMALRLRHIDLGRLAVSWPARCFGLSLEAGSTMMAYRKSARQNAISKRRRSRFTGSLMRLIPFPVSPPSDWPQRRHVWNSCRLTSPRLARG